MDIRKLQRAIVDGLEDVKAQDIVVFNTEHLSPLFERVVIATGSSNRQTKALAASVRDAVRAAGFQVMRTEGQDNGEWIIVDLAAAVVHIMQPAIRQYYQLEEIWGEKPVAVKLAAKTGLVKASEPEDDDEPVKPKKAAGKKTPAQKAATTSPVRKVAVKKAPAAKKAAAKPDVKAPAKKAAAPKVAVKKVAAKKVPAKKAAVVKTVKVNAPEPKKSSAKAPARKAAAKPVVRKVAAKKVAVKKVAAKKVAKKTAR
jgi:ribosome-associated protein